MSNRDLYKDEFGVYREVEEEAEETIDGLEDDEQDYYEEDEEDYLDVIEDEDDESFDEDREYASQRRTEYDADED